MGIPNLAEFTNVTSIEDAKNLWEKLRRMEAEGSFDPNDDEEVEDTLGNVYTKVSSARGFWFFFFVCLLFGFFYSCFLDCF